MAKPKSARPSTPVRTAHMCVLITVQLWYTIQHWTLSSNSKSKL